jgi:hypothetical protein
MLTIIEYSYFIKKASKILSDEQRLELIDFISVNYDKGSVMSGTGGVQKIRFAHQTGKGKSGAARVIYFTVAEKGSVYLLDIFEKNIKENLSDAEKNAIKKLATILKAKE